MKRNIFNSFFVVFAVVCFSLGLSACGGSKTWIAATVSGSLPTGVEHVYFETSKNEVDGAEQGKDLNFDVEFGVGYGVGTLKVFANGVEVTQKTLKSETEHRQCWNYTVPKVKEDVVLTFSGAAEKMKIGVEFNLSGENVNEDLTFNFADRKNMNFDQLKEFLSDAVPLYHQEQVVFEAVSQNGFLMDFCDFPNKYRKEGDKYISSTTFDVDVTKQYQIYLGDGQTLEEYLNDQSGFLGFRRGTLLTKPGQEGAVEVVKFADMTENMTLTVTDGSGLGNEVYAYLTDNAEVQPKIYFTINGNKINFDKVKAEGGKIIISEVLPVWKYSNAGTGSSPFAYTVSIEGLDYYFSLNQDKWVRVYTEGGRFDSVAWNEALDKHIFNATTPNTSINASTQEHSTEGDVYYFPAGEFGVDVKIDPFFEGETEKSYVFTLCGRSAVIKYTKTDDVVSATQISCDDGLTVTISPADENGLVKLNLSISDFSEWSGFSFDLAE